MHLQRYNETQNRNRDDQRDGIASKWRNRTGLFNMQRKM